MKKILLKVFVGVVFLLKTEVGCGQWVTIPDPLFANWISMNISPNCINGNLLDTTSACVTNTTIIAINNNNFITNLDGLQYFDNLIFFSLDYVKVATIPAFPNLIKNIFIRGDTALHILPSLPDSLEQLYLKDVSVSNLPSLPSFLLELQVYNSPILTMPSLPSSLLEMRVNNTLISSLPALPLQLVYLDCSGNLITSLPALPSTLITLNCLGCPLINLSVLPNSLETLWLSSFKFTTLPQLPNSLISLTCNSDSLINLPALPNSIENLQISYTRITSIPNLPDSLVQFHCGHNSFLTHLPPLPQKLNYLWCELSAIDSILSFPESLSTFDCYYCGNLKYIAELPSKCNVDLGHAMLLNKIVSFPDSLGNLLINDCPNLNCIPKLKTAQYLYFLNSGITCLPNYGNVANSSPLISSLPLCDLFNNNGCAVYWNISGKVYSDSTNNCINDYNEMQLANVKLILDSAGIPLQQTYTISEGKYSFDTDTGTYNYTVDTTNLPVLVTCPVTGFQTSVLTAIDSMDYDMDFGMQCKPGFDVGVKYIAVDSGRFRPANFARMFFNAGDVTNVYALHCASGISGTVKIVMNGPASFVAPANGSQIPLVTGDTLLYTVADFGTVNSFSDFAYIVQTDTTAPIGSLICFSVDVTPVSGDNNILNNSLQHCFSVTNSFDPNDKEVFPVGNFDSTQQWLTYTINFQNTGNAPAQHVYILDTLNTNLDAASFELLGYSHQPVTQIIGNVARFNFPNINLPDSVNDEPNSHGYVQYRVKLKQGLTLGTVIQNTAHIVFDFNAPVVTNTVTNALQDCSQLQLATLAFANTTLCKNDTLSATATLVFPMQTAWYLDGVFVGNGLTISTDTLSAGNHLIEMTALNSVCTQTISQTVFVDEPLQPTFNQNGNLLTSSSAINNQWYLNGSIIAVAVQNTFTLSQSGWYVVAVSDSLGCVAFSDSTYISAVGIEELQSQNIVISPNPFNEELALSLNNPVTNNSITISIFDVLGKEVFYSNNVKGDLKINTSKWAAGVYDLRIIFDDAIARKKIVKQ